LTRIWAILPTRSAEDAVRTAAGCAGRCGVAVTQALLAGPGPAVVAALAAVAPVMVLAGLHGDPADAALAARRLVEYGAAWVTVQAVDGLEVMSSIVDAVGGERVMAVTVRPGLDDAALASARLGESRGRVVSRLASSAADSGVGAVLCAVPDLGVVHQVAPHAKRFAWGVDRPAVAEEAFGRGAAAVILAPGVVALPHATSALRSFEAVGNQPT